jgi:5'-methylthioadenosine phosphorylase/5'-methylthioinosine phosphorylase
MSRLAIIGGSGFGTLPGLEIRAQRRAETIYGATSAPVIEGRLSGLDLCFLARHGPEHSLPPHLINYRANIRALADLGVEAVVALGAVGGIGPHCPPGTLCVPDQLVDYTHGRAHTFFEGAESGVHHVDFTEPYARSLRHALLKAAAEAAVDVNAHGTYAVTQGPRLETAAEIRRLQRDGCELVGMTAMPEAALAREAGIRYASLAFVVNWAAGVGDSPGPITMDAIHDQIDACAARIARVLAVLAQHWGAPAG